MTQTLDVLGSKIDKDRGRNPEIITYLFLYAV